MTEKEPGSRTKTFRVITVALVIILGAVCFFLMQKRPANGAEAKVQAELDALGRSDSVGSEVDTMRKNLTEEGRDNFDSFLRNLRNFDFEITGSREIKDGDDEHTEVAVRIRTYDFGREYLAAWSEYLKANNGAVPKNDDLGGFYEMLFERLAGLEEKEYIKDVAIICIEPLDNGEWIANIKENESLQDAIFGGMIYEMQTLAAE